MGIPNSVPELEAASGLQKEVDRRSAHRGRVLKAGKLRFHAGQAVIDCVIRDISALGARVKLSDTSFLPDRLELLVVKDDELHPGRVLWRSQGECGLVFTGPPRHARAL